jgi:pimeloyl-ACP methyl ester carboxylesterase
MFSTPKRINVKEVQEKYPHLKFVQVNDRRQLEYQIGGELTGFSYTVIATHGYGQTSDFFQFYSSLLRSKKCRLISISMPGFGFSDSVNRNSTRKVEEWISDVEFLLKEEKVDKFIAMGISAGGVHTICLGYHPNCIGLLLLAPTCPIDAEKESGASKKISFTVKLLRRAIEKKYIGEFIAFGFGCLSHKTRMNQIPDIKKALKAVGRTDPNLLEHFLKDGDRSSIYTSHGWYDNMKTLNAWKKSSFDLSKLERIPTLIVTAKDDFTNPCVMSEWVQRNIPNSELIYLDNGYGHLAAGVPRNFEFVFDKFLVKLQN